MIFQAAGMVKSFQVSFLHVIPVLDKIHGILYTEIQIFGLIDLVPINLCFAYGIIDHTRMMVYTNAKHKCYLFREDILTAIGEIIIVQYGVQIVEVDKGQKMFMQK